MKWNMWYTVGVAVFIVVLLAGGGLWFMLSRNLLTGQQTASVPAFQGGQQAIVLSPDDIGMSVVFRSDNKALKFSISKTQGITDV